MIASPPTGPETADVFARNVLAVATEIEAAEQAIKQAILDAAACGNCDLVIDIVRRWQTCPVTEVLQSDAARRQPP